MPLPGGASLALNGTVNAALGFIMDKDDAMANMVSNLKVGRTRRIAIAAVVVIAVGLLLAVVVVGFRGRHILQDSEAMTAPISAPADVGTRP
jgi:hypothetical protein